jgi:manganese/zinc/iron transport system permease protein
MTLLMQILEDLLRYNTLVILGGTSLLGLVSGIVGSLTVLRRRALAGDALAHATLPGLCLAFILVEERILPILLIGAGITGLLGLFSVSVISRNPRVKDDSALAIVLGVFFGLGIVLSRWIQNQTTEGSKAGLDSFLLGKTSGMILADVLLIALISVCVLVIIGALFKEFQLTLFDSSFAQATGWPVRFMDFLLMLLVGVVVVAGLPSVGVVLMTALLVIPAASARFWTNQLGKMCMISALTGMISCLCGVILSTVFEEMPSGALITVSATFCFCVSAVLAPCRGLLWQNRQKARAITMQTSGSGEA